MLNTEWNSQMMPCIFNGDPLVIKYSEHFMYIGERMILWWGGTRRGPDQMSMLTRYKVFLFWLKIEKLKTHNQTLDILTVGQY